MAVRRTRKFRCQGKLEREARASGFSIVAGADEAGRGSLFGPVFAAAVVLDPKHPIYGLRDSKLLYAAERERLAGEIRERSLAWAVASVDAFIIDRINIYQASCLAMTRAIEQLSPPPDYLLLDAVRLEVSLPQQRVVHGDQKSQAIAAASILAKVSRDAVLREWDRVYPWYGLRNNKGYATSDHLEALAVRGPTLQHRFSYEPVRSACPRSFRAILDLRESLHFPWEPQRWEGLEA